MEHFYKSVEGKFNFEDVYSDIVNKSDNNSHFIEIGCWRGCSSVYMAVEIINSGKKIKFDVVDCFNDDSCNIFLKNIEPVKDIINLKRGYSSEISKQYENNSIDFIFIDGNHDYDSIKNDILAWKPKLKLDGVIAGHDYSGKSFIGVVQAVEENFKSFKVYGGCWIVNMKNKEII